MGRIGITEILLIAVVFILLFGARKLPEIGASIGQAIKEFRKAMRPEDDSSKQKSSTNDESKA
jgi:sec-independent protein translocase protein TatA